MYVEVTGTSRLGCLDELRKAIGDDVALTVEVVPETPDELERLRTLLRRFGDETAARPGAFAVQLDGNGALRDVVRALDQENVHAAEINLHQPTLDDVFLAKTGRTLEGAEDEA